MGPTNAIKCLGIKNVKMYTIQTRKEEEMTKRARSAGIVVMGILFSLMVFLAGMVFVAEAAEPIKIGVLVSKTGWAGFAGTPEAEAIETVVDRVNREGGVLGRHIELYIEDDQSNPTNAAVAATKLIRDKQVSAIIGATVTVTCMPILPIVEREKVPNASLGAGHEITYPLKKWVFRIPLTDFRMAPVMLNFAKEQFNAKRIALLHSTDASAMMGAKSFNENAPKYGMSIVVSESFDPKDTNMIPQLAKVKAAKPDAIMLYTAGAPAIIIAKNYRQLEMKEPVIASHGVCSLEFLKQAPDYINPTWTIFGPKGVVASRLPPNDPYRMNLYEPFVKDLKEKFGQKKEFDGWAGVAHDGIKFVLEALKLAGTDERGALRDAMEKVSFKGFVADFKYSPTDHDGQAVVNIVPAVIKDHAFWPYQP
jgi:branched-chain amino acid transport system substrate-binding protein